MTENKMEVSLDFKGLGTGIKSAKSRTFNEVKKVIVITRYDLNVYNESSVEHPESLDFNVDSLVNIKYTRDKLKKFTKDLGTYFNNTLDEIQMELVAEEARLEAEEAKKLKNQLKF